MINDTLLPGHTYTKGNNQENSEQLKSVRAESI